MSHLQSEKFRIDSNLTDGEQVLIVLRRHWIVFVYLFGYALVLILSTLFLIAFIPSLSRVVPSGYLWLLLVVYWLFFLQVMYIRWIDDELDIFIITDKRVINIEQVGFLNRTRGEAGLDQIQEVNGRTKGFLGNMFHFGHLVISTASDGSDLEMPTVGNPLENARKIHNIVDGYRQKAIRNKNS